MKLRRKDDDDKIALHPLHEKAERKWKNPMMREQPKLKWRRRQISKEEGINDNDK